MYDSRRFIVQIAQKIVAKLNIVIYSISDNMVVHTQGTESPHTGGGS